MNGPFFDEFDKALSEAAVKALVDAIVDMHPAYNEFTVRKFVVLGMQTILSHLQEHTDSMAITEAYNAWHRNSDDGQD